MFTRLVQVALARWEQGELAEMRGELQAVVDRFPRAAFAAAWLSLADAELGDSDAARGGCARWPNSCPSNLEMASGCRPSRWRPSWPHASTIRRPPAILYPLVAPYADHIIAFTAPQPVACHGSASFYVGLLATVTSRWAEAADHFEAAIRAHDRLGARPFLARTRYEYARMLLSRGRPDDETRAFELLDRAHAAARTLGMAAVAGGSRRCERLRQGVAAADADSTAAAAETVSDVFRREGDYWTVRYEGSVVRLKDAKGLRHLARLLANPGREFHAVDLESADSPAALRAAGATGGPGPTTWRPAPIWATRGSCSTPPPRPPTRPESKSCGPSWRRPRASMTPPAPPRPEPSWTSSSAELARAVGLGGRDRRAAAHAERARLNATRAIRAAIANVARVHPSLGRHLASTIRTGRYCSYTPDPRVPIAWET